jgi:hypothetical protein
MNVYPIEISQLSKDSGKTWVLNNVNLTLQHLIDQGASNITITPASLEKLFLEFYQDGQGKPAQQQEAQGNQNQQQGGNSHA